VAAKNAGVQAAADGQFRAGQHPPVGALAQWRGPVLDDLRDFEFVGPFATALWTTSWWCTPRTPSRDRLQPRLRRDRDLEALVAEHPYREPLWAQLITAYYLSDRQSDALAAYQRLRNTLAEDLGIDPSPTVRALSERVLRQEPLNPRQAARTTAVHQISEIDLRTAVGVQSAPAQLRATSGRVHPLVAAATRIGRLPDNESCSMTSASAATMPSSSTPVPVRDHRSAVGQRCGGRRGASAVPPASSTGTRSRSVGTSSCSRSRARLTSVGVRSRRRH
jgi:hypothetical protein